MWERILIAVAERVIDRIADRLEPKPGKVTPEIEASMRASLYKIMEAGLRAEALLKKHG